VPPERIVPERAWKVLKSLETLLTHPEGFGLVTATPLQRAICRIAQGLPLKELAGHEHVLASLNITKPMELGGPPKELLLLAGIRGAKSLLAAALGVWWSQTCDLSGLGRGEVARVSLVSLTRDLAHVVFEHLRGNVVSSPVLRRWLVEKPTADTVMLWHPLGVPVEIKVVAGARAGASVVARWCAGICYDEAPRMIGADEGVVNLEHSQTAVRGRLLPGAQMISIGSPWAPYGPVYSQKQEYWGRPTRAMVVLKAQGPWLNPYWWTPERIKELREKDETAYQTDVLAEFADAETTMFPTALLSACARKGMGKLEHNDRCEYVAAMDPATRGNAWTLIIMTREKGKKTIVCSRYWQGSRVTPLNPTEVLMEIREQLAEYGLNWSYTDQYAGDALVDIASDVGLDLVIDEWTASNKTKAFMALQTEMAAGNVVIPDDPMLIKDMQMVKKRVTAAGFSIVLPLTPDGRHCDYAPPLAKCVSVFLEEEEEVLPRPGTREYATLEAEKIEQNEMDQFDVDQNRPWWDTEGLRG